MTKKPSLLLSLLVLVLLACSMSDIPYLVQPTPTLPPTWTPPPTATPSPVVFPTHTFTPTLIAVNTQPPSTFTPVATATAQDTTTPTLALPTSSPTASLASLSGTGFNAVNISSATFYWGACQPNTATLTVTVANPAQVADVVLFVRLTDKTTGATTPWDKGNSMAVVGPGVYSRTLNGTHMDVTEDSWVLYQFVGTDSKGQVVARSPVFHDTLSLSPCP